MGCSLPNEGHGRTSRHKKMPATTPESTTVSQPAIASGFLNCDPNWGRCAHANSEVTNRFGHLNPDALRKYMPKRLPEASASLRMSPANNQKLNKFSAQSIQHSMTWRVQKQARKAHQTFSFSYELAIYCIRSKLLNQCVMG